MINKELYDEVMGKVMEAAGVKYFTAAEVCPVGRITHDRMGRPVALKAPPAKLFGNILPTLEVADWLREAYGPIVVNSGYRDPDYNRAVGSTDGSMHVRFNALDLRPVRVSVRTLHRAALSHPLAHRMGIGLYDSFIHIDTRGLLCETAPARWDESSQRLRAA